MHMLRVIVLSSFKSTQSLFDIKIICDEITYKSYILINGAYTIILY